MERVDDLVSVIIPCYNHGQFLSEALDSVMQQTYQNFEIIIINDGSDDPETLRVLESVNLPDSIVLHKTNGGASSARNYGIEKSTGEYILTLDADDRFEPSFTEKAVSILNNNPETGMVTCYVKRCNGSHTTLVDLQGGMLEDFLIENHASASLLFRHQCWVDAGGYDEKIPGFEDWEFFINVTKHGWAVASIPEYLFYYKDIKGSNYDQHLKLRPEIIKYMVSKHKDAFQNHVSDVMYAKERNILELRSSIDTYRESYSQKIGNIILSSLKWVKKVI